MDGKFEIDQEKLANESIEKAKSRLAIVLNMLEITVQELKWACESQKWNDDVVFQIEEASTALGYSLATLINWDKDIPQ